MGPPLFFRVVGRLIHLYVRRPAGMWQPQAHERLLRDVNTINASHWLVRCTAIRCDGPAGAELAVTLEANLPAGLPTQELGACLFNWIAETGRIDRLVQVYLSQSDDDVAADEQRPDAAA
jgi:hypothetical protein